MTSDITDKFIGLQPADGYQLTKLLGEGKIGRVYLAEHQGFKHALACKIIREGGLKQGWERELEKVLQLHNVDNVVRYHSHGVKYDRDNRPYSFVMFDYVHGCNLRQFSGQHADQVSIAFICVVLETILNVLFACRSEKTFHGDLHAGNILIAEPDSRVRNSYRKVYLADFGYGGSHNHITPKDDFHELATIILDLLRLLRVETLNAPDRAMYEKLHVFATKRLRDA